MRLERDGRLEAPQSRTGRPTAIPLCVLQLRGPGHAARMPRGTAYLTTGTTFCSVIQYTESGEAVWHVVRSGRVDRQVPKGDAADAVQHRHCSSMERPSPNRDGVTDGAPSMLQPHAGAERSTRAASLVAEAERDIEAEQERFLNSIIRDLPLLKVLPPQSLVEQRYIADTGSALTPSMSGRAEWHRVASGAQPRGQDLLDNSLSWIAPHGAEAEGAPPTASSPHSNRYETSIESGVGVCIRVGDSCHAAHTLRSLTWGGCRPPVLRGLVWRLLSDYAPPQIARQRAELFRKRQQYEAYTRQYCSPLLAVTSAVSGAPAAHAIMGSFRGFNGQGPRRMSSLSRLPANPPAGPAPLSSSLSSLPIVGAAPDLTPSPSAQSPERSPAFAENERQILHQILLDLPRHRCCIYHSSRTVAAMSRVLFLWARRHPAVGYVQGMDDVVGVFYQVFLLDALHQHAREEMQRRTRQLPKKSEANVSPHPNDGGAHLGRLSASYYPRSQHRDTTASLLASSAPHTGAAELHHDAEEHRALLSYLLKSQSADEQESTAFRHLYTSEADLQRMATPALDSALDELPEAYLPQVEADTYWCAGRMLSFLQDNFVAGQPGILRSIRRLEALVAKVDPYLIEFLDHYGLTVRDACFQWLHCLLARELPIQLLTRLWDTYLVIGVGGDGVDTGGTAATAVALGGPKRANATSDEAMMVFHVCICCVLLGHLRNHVVFQASRSHADAAPPTPAAAAAAAMGGAEPGMPTSFYPTVAPLQRSGFWSGKALDLASNMSTWMGPLRDRLRSGGGDPPADRWSGLPAVDVVMQLFKHPFAALFPTYHSVHVGGSPSAAGATEENGNMEATVSEWMDVLIAEAYCIWCQHGTIE